MTESETASFEKFLLAEYEHISEAHFATHESISAFFKNYLAIVGLPLAAVPLALRFVDNRAKIQSIADYLGAFPIVAAVTVAVIGFCMMLHILNLRHDSLLYARTVNGIRNFFYETAALPANVERTVRLLPRAMDKPKYTQLSFLPTVVAFGVLNGAYPAIAVAWMCATRPGWGSRGLILGILTVVVCTLFHCLIFVISSRRTESRHSLLAA